MKVFVMFNKYYNINQSVMKLFIQHLINVIKMINDNKKKMLLKVSIFKLT